MDARVDGREVTVEKFKQVVFGRLDWLYKKFQDMHNSVHLFAENQEGQTAEAYLQKQGIV